jgi:hypothetical protein
MSDMRFFAFPDPALTKGSFHVRSDIDKPAPGRDIKPEFFAIGFHIFSSIFRIPGMILLESHLLR